MAKLDYGRKSVISRAFSGSKSETCHSNSKRTNVYPTSQSVLLLSTSVHTMHG